MSSGSSRAESIVESTRSQNITVSYRVSADAPVDTLCGVGTAGVAAVGSPLLAVSLLPHAGQNFAPERMAAPQHGHRPGRGAPHSSQNLLSSGMSARQLGHSMRRSLARPALFCFKV